jgi:trans-aconitate 2-methyltransferase
MTPTWEPATYLRFADERSRPFFELLARVGAEDPAYVVDLGCGPGNLTATLAERWPAALVQGIDSSADMLAAAAEHRIPGRLELVAADVRRWHASQPVDVLVSNATLQWVPGHLELLGSLVEQVRPGGWFALQVPGNFAEPSHVLLRELAADQRFAGYLSDVHHPAAHDPADYLRALRAAGCAVDAWETTYLHVLSGPDPVLRWIAGTGARPVLQALPGPVRTEFEAEYADQLAAAYPRDAHGTLLSFRRVFAVAQREEGA